MGIGFEMRLLRLKLAIYRVEKVAELDIEGTGYYGELKRIYV